MTTAITGIPKPCQRCAGAQLVLDEEAGQHVECPRCQGSGYDTPVGGCCDEGEEHEHDEGRPAPVAVQS